MPQITFDDSLFLPNYPIPRRRWLLSSLVIVSNLRPSIHPVNQTTTRPSLLHGSSPLFTPRPIRHLISTYHILLTTSQVLHIHHNWCLRHETKKWFFLPGQTHRTAVGMSSQPRLSNTIITQRDASRTKRTICLNEMIHKRSPAWYDHFTRAQWQQRGSSSRCDHFNNRKGLTKAQTN